MSVSSEERVERIPAAAGVEQIPATVGITLAAFYDKRAPAALAYCARACPPEGIADAVEAAFARLFEVASRAEEVELDELDARLRAAVRAESVARTPPPESRGRRFERGARCEDVPRLLAARAGGELGEADASALDAHLPGCAECRSRRRTLEEAERAYDSLSGDDAPALGRPLVAELVGELPPPASLDRRIAEWLGGAEVGRPPVAEPTPPPPPPPPPGPSLGERARGVVLRSGAAAAHAARVVLAVPRAL